METHASLELSMINPLFDSTSQPEPSTELNINVYQVLAKNNLGKVQHKPFVNQPSSSCKSQQKEKSF